MINKSLEQQIQSEIEKILDNFLYRPVDNNFLQEVKYAVTRYLDWQKGYNNIYDYRVDVNILNNQFRVKAHIDDRSGIYTMIEGCTTNQVRYLRKKKLEKIFGNTK